MVGEFTPSTLREKKLEASPEWELSQLGGPQRSGTAKTSASSSLTAMIGCHRVLAEPVCAVSATGRCWDKALPR